MSRCSRWQLPTGARGQPLSTPPRSRRTRRRQGIPAVGRGVAACVVQFCDKGNRQARAVALCVHDRNAHPKRRQDGVQDPPSQWGFSECRGSTGTEGFFFTRSALPGAILTPFIGSNTRFRQDREVMAAHHSIVVGQCFADVDAELESVAAQRYLLEDPTVGSMPDRACSVRPSAKSKAVARGHAREQRSGGTSLRRQHRQL